MPPVLVAMVPKRYVIFQWPQMTVHRSASNHYYIACTPHTVSHKRHPFSDASKTIYRRCPYRDPSRSAVSASSFALEKNTHMPQKERINPMTTSSKCLRLKNTGALGYTCLLTLPQNLIQHSLHVDLGAFTPPKIGEHSTNPKNLFKTLIS